MKKSFFLGALFGILLLSIGFVTADQLAYDGNGNVIKGDGFFREYNSFNNLVTVRAGNSPSSVIIEKLEWHPVEDRVLVKHVYNTSGVWQETITYVSESFVRVKNSSGEFDTTYAIQKGQKVAQQNDDGSKYFLHDDHLGSVSLITDESGAIVEETIYSPFGEIVSGGETSLFDYEGKEFDSVTGNYDFNARRYDPSLGLFEQPDPIIQNVYDPQTLNHYAFERNSPYKYTDPSGRRAELIVNEETGVASIEATIYIYGDGASKRLAARIQDRINNGWSGFTIELNGKEYELQSNINVRFVSQKPDSLGKYDNAIKIRSLFDSIFSLDPSFVKGRKTGEWSSIDLQGDLYTHEAGHLFGLKDRYEDVNIFGIRLYTYPQEAYEDSLMSGGSNKVTETDVTNLLTESFEEHQVALEKNPFLVEGRYDLFYED